MAQRYRTNETPKEPTPQRYYTPRYTDKPPTHRENQGGQRSQNSPQEEFQRPQHQDAQRMKKGGRNKKKTKPYGVPPPKRTKKGTVIMNILLVVFALIFLGSAGYLVYDGVYLPYKLNQGIEVLTEDIETFDMESEEVYVEEVIDEDGQVQYVTINDTVEAVRALRETYPDMVGWLKIDNTDVQLPVMQSSTSNSEYYLYKDYTGSYSKYGSLFVDAWTEVGGDNQVIYGHHMKDGNMFACLTEYTDLDYYKETPVIQYDTYLEAGQWKIIAVFKANTYYSQGDPFIYNIDDFSSDEEKMEFIYQCMTRSVIDTGVDVTDSDVFITLSTCSYEYDGFRTVVVARKVREGEDATVDVSQATYNANVVYPDVWYSSTSSIPSWPDTLAEAVSQGLADWYVSAD